MEFHFNAELAKQYGVDGAIFLHCMAFWVAKNRANGRHYHEGRYWTYNTLEALSKLFPLLVTPPVGAHYKRAQGGRGPPGRKFQRGQDRPHPLVCPG